MRMKRHRHQEFRMSIALLLVLLLAFGGALQVFALKPLNPGGNAYCGDGCILAAKFKVSGNNATYEKGISSSTVTIQSIETVTGTTYQEVTWSSEVPIYQIIVKGGSDHVMGGLDEPEGSFGGTFTTEGLPLVGNNNIPGISNLKFCTKKESIEPKLIIKKVVVNENDEVIGEDKQTFTIELCDVEKSKDLSQGNDIHLGDLDESTHYLKEVKLPAGYTLLGYEFNRWEYEENWASTKEFYRVDEKDDKTLKLDCSILRPLRDLKKDVTITIFNRFVSDEEPKLIIKKVVWDDNDVVIEDDTTEFTFKFTELKEIDEIIFEDDELSQDNSVSVYGHNIEMTSVLEEIDLPNGYELIGYEYAEYTEENGYSGETKIHNVEEIGNKGFLLNSSIGYSMWKLKEDATITIINRHVPEDEPEFELIIEKRLLNANNVVIGSSTVPFDVEVAELGEDGFNNLYDNEDALTVNSDIIIMGLSMGTYTVEELLTVDQEDDYELLGYEVEGAALSATASVTFTDEDVLDTTKTVVVVNRIIPDDIIPGDDDDDDDDNGGGGTTPTTTPTPTPAGGVPIVTTTVIEPLTPLAVPQVPEPVIELDEPFVPLAAPELPQTGVANPVTFYLSGLLLAAAGWITRKRK